MKSGKGKGEGKGGAASPGLRPKKGEFKITLSSGIYNEVGYLGYIKVGAVDVPVTYHEIFDLSGMAWRCSDAATGTRLGSGATRSRAKAHALENIAKVGPALFLKGQKKFREICYGGKTISDFNGHKVTDTKIAKYNAWARIESAKRSAEPKAKPSKSSPKASPKGNPSVTPRTRRAGK